MWHLSLKVHGIACPPHVSMKEILSYECMPPPQIEVHLAKCEVAAPPPTHTHVQSAGQRGISHQDGS